MMNAASRGALDVLRRHVGELSGAQASSAALTSLAGELFTVAETFVGQPRLRRTAGDPATSPQDRGRLIDMLFASRISATALDVVRSAVGQRWSSPWDLTDALETIADEVLLRVADQDGTLDEVEDELFRLERILGSEGQLTTLLDEVSVPGERRVGLLRELIAAKVSPITLELVEHAVTSTRRRSIELAIDGLVEAAAARRAQSIARVVSAVPLTDEQEARLAAVLSSMYGRGIEVRTAVEPAVRGGLVIRVGGEVIDGSVASRFAAARAALAG